MPPENLPPRIKHLLNGFLAARPEVFSERAVLATRSYVRTEGQPILLRRAALLEDILDGVQVVIRQGELIVGCKTPAILGSPLYPEIACDWVEKELDSIALRQEAPFQVAEETKAALRKEVFDYWRGKQVYDRIMEALPPEVIRATQEGLFFHYFLNRSIGHITVDYERVLKLGFLGLKEEVEAEMGRIDYESQGALNKYYLLDGYAQML
jgi:pyruvate-formate lyase